MEAEPISGWLPRGRVMARVARPAPLGPGQLALGGGAPGMGCGGCTPRGEPTLGSRAGVPSLDRPCSRLDDSGPAGRSGCAEANPAPPLPSPVSALQVEAGPPPSRSAGRVAAVRQPEGRRRSPSQALPRSRSEPSSVGDPRWPSSTPTGVCLRERLGTWRAGTHISHLL